MGGQTKRKFSTKNDSTGQKNDFFRIFFCCTSTHQCATFLFLPKFHIFSRSEKSWEDQKKRYIERTNDKRRTTWTIIIPRQDSQNPRANNVNITVGIFVCDKLFDYTGYVKKKGMLLKLALARKFESNSFEIPVT